MLSASHLERTVLQDVPQAAPTVRTPEVYRPRVKPQLRRRARFFEAPPSANYCLPGYIRPRLRPPQLSRRARFVEVVPAQTLVSAFPPVCVRPRVKPMLSRRARMFEPSWPQGAQPQAPTLMERAKMGVGV